MSTEKRSVLTTIAARYDMEPAKFAEAVRATVVPDNVTAEEFMAFVAVANEYRLNPLTREIYAFKTGRGAMQCIVGIDGWLKIMNEHPAFDGIEVRDTFDESQNLVACTATIYRKDRSHPTTVTEYMHECRRDTDPWKRWPARLLRHKASIQCARYAFGITRVIDADEAERIVEGTTERQNEPYRQPVIKPPKPTDEQKEAESTAWYKAMADLESAKTTAECMAISDRAEVAAIKDKTLWRKWRHALENKIADLTLADELQREILDAQATE